VKTTKECVTDYCTLAESHETINDGCEGKGGGLGLEGGFKSFFVFFFLEGFGGGGIGGALTFAIPLTSTGDGVIPFGAKPGPLDNSGKVELST